MENFLSLSDASRKLKKAFKKKTTTAEALIESVIKLKNKTEKNFADIFGRVP
jgi:hypothetical protein